MKVLNVHLLVILLICGVFIGIGVHFLHDWQVHRNAGIYLREAEEAEERADIAEKAGQFAIAIEERENVAANLSWYIRCKPKDVDVLEKLGFLLCELSDYKRAFRTFERLLRLDPSRTKARRELVNVALAIGRFPHARVHLQEYLLKDDPENPEFLELLGKCQEAMLDIDEAIMTYQEAIEIDPKQVTTYKLLADLLRREREQDDEANRIMESLVELNPDSLDAHLTFGEYLRKYDRIDEAMQQALIAIKLGPDSPKALWLAARCALGQEDFETGRKYARSGIEKFPDYIALYTALADIELRAERWEAAIAALEQGLKANENHQQLLWSMANLLIDTGQVDEAEGVIARLKSAHYPPALVGYLTARVAFTQGEWLTACREFDQVRGDLSLMSDLTKKIDLWVGKAYGKLGNTDQQIARLRQAIRTDRLFAPARLALAEALLQTGQLDEAMIEYSRLRERKREIRRGVIPWARMQVLRTLRAPPAQRDWTAAETAIKEAVQTVPDAIEIPVLRAEVLLAQGRPDEARAFLIRARDEKPEEVEFWKALASLAQRQGDWDRVERILEEAERRLGDKPTLRIARARYLVKRHGKAAAKDLWKMAQGCEKFSESQRLQLWQGLVNAFLQVDDVQRTTQLCQWIVDTDRNNVGAHFRLFELSFRAKDDQGMRQALRELERVEHGPLWLYGRAVRLSIQAEDSEDRKLDQALTLLARASESRPTWPRIPLLAAAIHEQKGNGDEALQNYLKAIDLGTQNANAIRKTLEILVYREQRLDKAYQVLQRFSTIPPELLPMSRDIHLGRGDLSHALEDARKVAAQSDDFREHIWLGQILILKGQQARARRKSTDAMKMYNEAEKALRKATELGGENAAPWVALIQFLASTNQRSKALKTIEQVEAKVPADQVDLALARCHEALGDRDKAKPLFEKVLAANPDDPLLVRTVADFYLRAKHATLAEKQLLRIIDGKVESKERDVIWARYQMALLLDGHNTYRDREEGIRLLRENLKSGESTASDRHLLAHLIAKGPGYAKREEAIELFQDMMKPTLPPDDLAVLAKLYLAKKDHSKARSTMQKLLASHGNNPKHVAQYVQILLKCEDLEAAKWWLFRLEELAPRQFALASLRAEFLVGKGEYDQAIEVLLDFLEDPKCPPADPVLKSHLVAMRLEALSKRLNGDKLAEIKKKFRAESEKRYRQFVAGRPQSKIHLAAFLARDGRFEESMNMIESVQDTAPPFQVAKACGVVINSGNATSAQRRRAEELLQIALKRSDRPDALLMVVADAHTRLGRYAAAESIYRKAIEANPEHAIAMNNLAVLLALQHTRLDEALDLINRAMEIAGPDSAMIDSRATVYIAMGESDKALEDINTALTDAETPVRLFHLAQIYNQGGRPKSAVATFSDAEELGLTPDIIQPLELPAYEKFKAIQEQMKQQEPEVQQ